MRCFHPLTAWQLESGEIVFAERGAIRRQLQLRCGQCIGCRLTRAEDWSVRCMHEAKCHSGNSFVTLTYDDDHCPSTLIYDHFRLFMRRVRRKFPGARFYMCGEYGERFSRPHFHAILFGVFFEDRVVHSCLASGFKLYRSATLSALWTKGFSSVGDVSQESAGYVARYTCKKVTGDAAVEHYTRYVVETGEVVQLVPEFGRMSLKDGGIGANFISKYKSDVFGEDKDCVRVHEHAASVPKYYTKVLARDFGLEYDEFQYRQFLRSEKLEPDNSPDRLRAQEEVAHARLKLKVRNLE